MNRDRAPAAPASDRRRAFLCMAWAAAVAFWAAPKAMAAEAEIVSDAGPDGTYAINERIRVSVTFDTAVDVTGTPVFELRIGGATRDMTWSADGANHLEFGYTVVDGDLDADGIGYAADALQGGQITHAGDPVDRQVAAVDNDESHKVDGVAPTATVAITSSAGTDETYAIGDMIEVDVAFDEDVVVHGAVALILSLGPATGDGEAPAQLKRRAGIVQQRGGLLTFRYRVQAGDLDPDGISVAPDALDGDVADRAGNPAAALPAVGDAASHKVDGIRPAVAGVEITSDAGSDQTYAFDDTIEVAVSFTEVVHADQRSGVAVQIGPNARLAAFAEGSGTRTLRFRYAVAADDIDADGISLRADFLTCAAEDVACISDQAGNPVDGPVNGVPAQPRHRVDGVPPVSEGIEITSDPGADGVYGVGDAIEFAVSFSEIVHGDQALSLVVQIGGNVRHAAFVDGSGTPTLRFRYRVVAEDRDDDGISLRSRPLSCGNVARFACITDAAGNVVEEPVPGLAAQPRHRVDGRLSRPLPTIVSSPAGDNVYGVGEDILVDVDFRQVVHVRGAPELLLSIGGEERSAGFHGGSGTAMLRFRYTVQVGDADSDGVSVGPGPESLTGGQIVDASNAPVSRVFDPIGPLGGHRVDGLMPSAIAAEIVSVPIGDAYGLGEYVEVQVTFDETVHVTSAEQLALIVAIGPHSRQSGYRDGSGTRTLAFAYRIAADDRDEDGISIGPDAVVGGVIEDVVGNNWSEADRRIPGVSPSTAHRVNPDLDQVPPTVVEAGVRIISRPSQGGRYAVGEPIEVEVEFDETVYVTGTPTLEVSIGGAGRSAAFVGGSGSRVLSFRYTVQADDVDEDGISIAPGSRSLTGGTIADEAGNTATREFAALSADPGHRVNAEGATTRRVEDIRIVSPPSVYAVGDAIDIEVAFDDVVHVNGDPVVVLSVGTEDRDAGYTSGSGTTTLTFRYIVQAGDYDDDGVSIGPDSLIGGTIEDAGGAPAARSTSGLPPDPSRRVDGLVPSVEVVSIVANPGSRPYRAGDPIGVDVVFDDVVYVTGDPVVVLSVGAEDRDAAYATGSGTRTLRFGYVVQAGDHDDDGVSIAANALSGGTIEGANGNVADRAFAGVPPSAAHRVIVPQPPAIVEDGVRLVSRPAENGSYGIGELIEVEVVFSDLVYVTGDPVVVLSVGAEDRDAAYATGSGTRTLRFGYVVQAGDHDDDGVSIAANALSGGTIEGATGTTAHRTFEAVRPADAHMVDGRLATVESIVIVSRPSGDRIYYTSGESIEVEFRFDRVVHATGDPALTLSIGAHSREAAFDAGSGTEALLFVYTVTEADYDHDGISIGANALTGGSIEDDGGNAVIRTHPSVAAQEGHRVWQEVNIVLAPLALTVGKRADLDLAAALADAGLVHRGGFAAKAADETIASVRTDQHVLSITPLSEGSTVIDITAQDVPLTLSLPVTVRASAAETAVLTSALAAVARGLLSSAAGTIGARLEQPDLARPSPGGGRPMRSAHNRLTDAVATGACWELGLHGCAGYGPGAGPSADRPDGARLAGGLGRDTSASGNWANALALAQSGLRYGGSSWGAWAAVDVLSFDGEPDQGSYDGNLRSFHLGADARGDGWIAGASASYSLAETTYEYAGEAPGAGTLETEVTALYPYVQWTPAVGTTVWTIVGFGTGEATTRRGEPADAANEASGLSLRLALAGGRFALGGRAGFALAVRGDAGLVQVATEDGIETVQGLSVAAQRLRLGVEAGWPNAVQNGVLTPFVDLGGRWDGGDGGTGAGVEVAGGLRYRAPGFSVDVKGRALALHSGDVAENGLAATFVVEPSAQTGLRLSLTPRWGAGESRDVLWRRDYSLASSAYHQHRVRRAWTMDGRLDYAFALRRRHGTVAPFVEAGMSRGTGSRGRLGFRYDLRPPSSTSAWWLEISSEAVEHVGRGVEQRLRLAAEGRL